MHFILLLNFHLRDYKANNHSSVHHITVTSNLKLTRSVHIKLNSHHMKRTGLSFLSTIQSASEHDQSIKENFSAATSLEAGIDEIKKELVKMTNQFDQLKLSIENEKKISDEQINMIKDLYGKYIKLIN